EAAQSRIAACTTSVPTTLRGFRRKTVTSIIPISVPLPAEESPITKPVAAPMPTAAILWRGGGSAASPASVCVVGGGAPAREGEPPKEGCGTHHQQAAGEDREDRLVELVPQVAFQEAQEPDAEQRHRNAADRHPVDERQVHRLKLQVAPGARGLGDRRVEDVG